MLRNVDFYVAESSVIPALQNLIWVGWNKRTDVLLEILKEMVSSQIKMAKTQPV